MSAVRKISARVGNVKLQWNAYVKELVVGATGAPVLRLLVSGTKLDSAASMQDGIPILGDRMTPEFLQTMCLQAKTGGVYLLENHSATLRMGVSIDAEITVEPDGNQSLYIDFELFPDNPNVPAFILDLERGYQPQCSVGVFAARVIEWDPVEGGYVGLMVEGSIEHVALTRPDHAAYPPAKIEAMFAAGKVREAIGAALKDLPAIPTSTLVRLEKQRARSSNAGARRPFIRENNIMPKQTGPENGVKVRAANDPLILKEAEDAAKEAATKEDAAKEPAPAAEPAPKEDATKAESEMCKECGKSKEDCKCKEAAAKEDEAAAGDPPPPPAADPDPDDDGDTAPEVAETLENHVAAIKDMLVNGADPKDMVDYVQGDLLPDLEKACVALGGDPDAEGDGDEEKSADAAKEDEDEAKAPPPPPPAADDAPAKKDPPPAPEKKEDAAPAVVKAKDAPADKRTAARLSLKEKLDARRSESAVLRELRKLVKKSDEQAKEIGSLKETLKHLDSDDPATPRARRYDGGSDTGDSEMGLEELLRTVTDPVAREELSKAAATMLVKKLRPMPNQR